MATSKRRFRFPDPRSASPDGIVVAGGTPEPELLKTAYSQGIFPWPHEGYPLLWFSPDPRFVLPLHEVKIPRSLRKVMRKGTFEVRADTAFDDVMRGCGKARRPGQRGTWITDEMREGYGALHKEGVAHSIECWAGADLVGGLYGISLGACFYGESMFAKVPDASKVAFATLLGQLAKWRFPLVDCQSYTEHLARFGAVHWPREQFLTTLAELQRAPTRPGPWTFDVTPAMASELFVDEGGLERDEDPKA